MKCALCWLAVAGCLIYIVGSFVMDPVIMGGAALSCLAVIYLAHRDVAKRQ
jgi:hypothetical protein